MSQVVGRHQIRLHDATVYVGTGEEAIWVGDIAVIRTLIGGAAWTITYTDRQKARYPDLDTSDEGLTIDIVDFINDMEIEAAFREILAELPVEKQHADGVPPRTGLFTGRLLEELETGLD
jgi:hypothetical protein